jgi:Rrf2 family protein
MNGRPVPARTEYAVRAALGLAAAQPATVKARVLAETQRIPPAYLYDVLADLRRVELVRVWHGPTGGYALTQPAATVTIGGLLRLLDGPPIVAPARKPDAQPDTGLVARLHQVWTAVDNASQRVLDEVTLADIVSDRIPPQVVEIAVSRRVR